MIKTPENRKDISFIVDRWEKIIESRLDEVDLTQGIHAFLLDGRMSDRTIQELKARYKQAGWCVHFITWGNYVDMSICIPEELNKCTD